MGFAWRRTRATIANALEVVPALTCAIVECFDLRHALRQNCSFSRDVPENPMCPCTYRCIRIIRYECQRLRARWDANLWRTTTDIRDEWSSMIENVEKQVPTAAYAGPGHWNDPDMLEIGNGHMTDDEYRTHMSLWALVAAPLLAGNDLRTMSAATKSILMNREVMALVQIARASGLQ
jgi:hypothetical protein